MRKTRISEEYNKDVKLASREPNEFIAYNGFMAPENGKIFRVTSRNVFIRQK
jgi:hypothetical protein